MKWFVALMCLQLCNGLPVAPHGSDQIPLPISFQDLNIVQLTDVHSWLSGHRHETIDEADIGDTIRQVFCLGVGIWTSSDFFLISQFCSASEGDYQMQQRRARVTLLSACRSKRKLKAKTYSFSIQGI